MAIRKPRGTQDFLPEQIVNWHYIEQRMRDICKAYGFSEIRTPAFEDTKIIFAWHWGNYGRSIQGNVHLLHWR